MHTQLEEIINSHNNGQFKQYGRQVRDYGVRKYFLDLADYLHEIKQIDLYWKLSVSFYNTQR